MAGGQKKLESEIRIGGKALPSLNQLAGKLGEIANIVGGISNKSQQVLEDSLEYFKGYEQNMLDAKGALSAQYTSYTELERVMNDLDVQAQNWAATSIFHTSDVSKAISEAAHAGWNYEQMVSGIPAAMQLAQAGGYELSSALDQVIKVTNASGTEFENVGGMIDMWTMAANLGATSVEEMGGALTKMGSTVQFAGGMDQAFTMLTVLANMGTVGEEAGTLLRNSMLRLIAPTKKAADAMAGLEVTDDEASALEGDAEALAAANAQLEKYGFSVYNEKGELKDMTTIFSDLSKAVDGMTDQERNGLLSAIFPTRTITGAMNLLKSIENGSWTEILAQMSEAKGYAEDVADIQNEGYGRQIELFTSKIEALETKIGSFAAPNIENIMGVIGGVLDKFNSADPTVIAGITGMLEGLAVVGPLTAGAAAVKGLIAVLSSSTFGPIFYTAAGVAALAAGIGALIEVSNQDFKSNFGDMALDIKTLDEYVQSIGTEFFDGTGQITTAYNELTSAIAAYEAGVGTFMSGIDTAAITGNKLTQAEITQLTNYGKDIGNAVLDGITQAENLSKAGLNSLYANADGEVDAKDSVMYSHLWNNLERLYGSLSAEASSVGARLGEAMSSALSDGIIDINEQSIIQGLVSEYNAIEQQVAAILAKQNLYEQINAASSVSWDSFATFLQNTQDQYQDTVNKENAIIDGLEAAQRLAIEDRIGPMTDEQWLNRFEYKNLEDKRRERLAAAKEEFQRPTDIAIGTLMGGKGVGDAWDILRKMAATGASASDFYDQGMWSQYSDVDIPTLFKQFDAMGDAFTQMAEIAPDLVDTESFQWYRNMAGQMRERAQVSKEQYTASGLTPSQYAAQYNPEGKKVTVAVNADTSSAESSINALGNKSVTIDVNANVRQSGMPSMLKFAEGGRATRASIFGEAGAEWAIPEQHSEHTADLLDSARKASGFTWGELIARTGGLNSGSSSGGNTFVYSPTINANDTNGVADALARDKESMKRWWKQMQTRNSMEVYA